MAYWYNVRSGLVEEDANKSRMERLLGPFETYAAAEQALAHAQENTERWDAEDKAWEDDELED